MFAYLLLIAFAATINAAPSLPSDCPQRVQEMDQSMKPALFITNKNQKLYNLESEVNSDYCVPMKEHLKVIGNYRPCLRAFPKQLFSMVLANAKKNVKSICGTANQRTDLINNLKCFTNETFPEFVQLGYDITSLVNYLANMTNIDNIIPGLCCGYHLIMADARTKLDTLCNGQGVGSSGPEYFLGLVQAAMSDAIDMMCGSYANIESCDSKIPSLVEEIKQVKNETANVAYDYTMVIPFLRVIDRIDTETNINN